MFPLHDDNPTSRFAIVTAALVVACIVAFAWQFQAGGVGPVAIRYGLIPARLVGDVPGVPGSAGATTSVITSMFLHGGFMHLAGNVLFLWIFGNNVEDATGRGKFLIFYLLCGIAAAALQVAVAPDSRVPMIGASGAVSGVLGAYLLLHPRARVSTLVFLGIFITVIRLRAWVLLGVWFAGQALSAASTPPGAPGVAWFAHVGGFIAGMALVAIFKRADVPWFDDGGLQSKEGKTRQAVRAPRIWLRRRGPW